MLFQKRLREQLRNATAGDEIDELETCMEKCINNRMEDGGDLTEAQRRLDFLHCRKGIQIVHLNINDLQSED